MGEDSKILKQFLGDADFPIDWSSEEEKGLFWFFDDLHCPQPLSPMYFDIGGLWPTCDPHVPEVRHTLRLGLDCQEHQRISLHSRHPCSAGDNCGGGRVGQPVRAKDAGRRPRLPGADRRGSNAVLPTYGAHFADWWSNRLVPEMIRNFEYLEEKIERWEEIPLMEWATVLEDAIDIHDRHWKIHWMHVALVHLDCGHAAIGEIDTSAAAGIEGVVRVFTARDLPHPVPRFGPRFADRPVIATGETKYHGEPLAAVVAVSKEAAAEGAAAVRVEYKELPGVYSIDDALDPASPLVVDPGLRSADDPLADSNVRQRWDWGWGDVESTEAEVVIEETYTFPMVTHFSIEPHAFAAAPEGGGVAVWSSIQHPYFLQGTLASLLRYPHLKGPRPRPGPGWRVRGKGIPKIRAARHHDRPRVGTPCKARPHTRGDFPGGPPHQCPAPATHRFHSRRPARLHRCHRGLHDGRFMPDIAPRVISKSSYFAAGPYKVGAVRAVVRGLMSHTTPSTAFRGFGAPR